MPKMQLKYLNHHRIELDYSIKLPAFSCSG